MKIILPDGYNGHTVECDAKPLEFDEKLVKLQVSDSYMTRWLYRDQWEKLTNGRVLDNGVQVATWRINPETGYTDIVYPDGKIYVCDFANYEVVADR